MAKFFTKSDDGNYEEVEAFSQEEVDGIVTKRLERQKSQYADYDDVKAKAESVDSLKNEYEEKLKAANTKATELETQLGEAKLGTEKVKIMHEFKLSDNMAEFVTGKDADEMRQKAEKLHKGIPGGKVNIDKDGKPKDGEAATDSKAIAGKLFGKKSDD